MKTLKRIALSYALLCALAASSFAQSASDITVSGILYNAFNDVCTSCTFTVTVTRRDGVAVQSTAKTVTSNSSTGAVSFTLPRKAFATFTGNYTVGRYSWKSGISFFIPDQSTVDIVDLQSVDDAAAGLVAVSAAPSNAQYIVGTVNSTLTAEQSLGALSTGLLKNTVSAAVGTLSTATAGTDYVAPGGALGTPSSGTLTNATGLPPVTGIVGWPANASGVLMNNGSGTLSWATSSGGSWGSITGTLSSQTDLQAALDLKAALASPALTGSPTATRLTLTGTAGSGYVGYIAQSSPAGAPGSGFSIFADSSGRFSWVRASDGFVRKWDATLTADRTYTLPDVSGTVITSGNLSAVTTLPSLTSNGIVTTSGGAGTLGVTVPGTGVLTALGVNVGSAGAFVTFNGAGGTPSSLTLTNATGLPPTTGISGWPANASGVLMNNGSGTLSWAAAGSGITVGTTTITGGTTARVLFNNGGVVGEYAVTGSGNAVLSASPTLTGTVGMAAQTNTGTITQTSASATAFESGPNGGTNPVFRLVNSTASSATGLSITGNAAGSGVVLTALSSGSNEDLLLVGKGTGHVGSNKNGGVAIGIQVSGQAFVGIGRNSTIGGLNLNGGNTDSDTAVQAIVTTNSLKLDSTFTFGWASTNATQNLDTILRRSAAANLAQGAVDVDTAPVAQINSVQNALAGGTSNVAGANWTRNGSQGKGTGVGGALIWQVAPAGSTGTTVNSLVEAMRITGAGVIQYPATITAGGTTGNQTINKVSGTVNFAAAATSLTVTNSLVSANSTCFAVVRTNDSTATIKNVVPGSGSFVINLGAAATAETSVGFFCINP